MFNKKTLNESRDLMEHMGDFKPSPFSGYHLLSEANLNHIMKNAEKNGIVVISANRSSVQGSIPNTDLTSDFEEWAKSNQLQDTEQNQEKFLNTRNRECYKELEDTISRAGYSYSKVYGGYKETIDDKHSNYVFEPSIIIYATNRKGQRVSFEQLFDFAKELARKYKQETFYAQFPGQAPNYYNQDGKVVNKNSSKDFKFNREGETYFTTTKLSKNPEVPRFTADISSTYDDDGNLLQVTEAKLYFYEHWVKSGVGQISERMHREWKGECVL